MEKYRRWNLVKKTKFVLKLPQKKQVYLNLKVSKWISAWSIRQGFQCMCNLKWQAQANRAGIIYKDRCDRKRPSLKHIDGRRKKTQRREKHSLASKEKKYMGAWGLVNSESQKSKENFKWEAYKSPPGPKQICKQTKRLATISGLYYVDRWEFY